MPRRTISTTTQAPSITIIQGGYEKFCVPSADHQPTMYGSSQQLFRLIVASDESAALDTIQDNWLKFQRLVVEWRKERGVMSSITEAAVCPAYQSIIGMGEAAVPFIIATLESEGDEPDQWFWALKAITMVDPVRDEERGNYIAMAACWLDWARRVGHAW